MLAKILQLVSLLTAGGLVGDAVVHPDAGWQAIAANLATALGLGGVSFVLSKESVAQWLTWGKSAAHDIFDDSTLPPDMQAAANAAYASRDVHPEAAAQLWGACWDRYVANAPVKPEIADHA